MKRNPHRWFLPCRRFLWGCSRAGISCFRHHEHFAKGFALSLKTGTVWLSNPSSQFLARPDLCTTSMDAYETHVAGLLQNKWTRCRINPDFQDGSQFRDPRIFECHEETLTIHDPCIVWTDVAKWWIEANFIIRMESTRKFTGQYSNSCFIRLLLVRAKWLSSGQR